MVLTGSHWLRQLTRYSGLSQNNKHIIVRASNLKSDNKIGLLEINQRKFFDSFLGICILQASGHNNKACSMCDQASEMGHFSGMNICYLQAYRTTSSALPKVYDK